VDGVIGPQTLAAAKAADPSKLVDALCDERLAFLKSLKTWPVFSKGWGRRVTESRALAHKMISGAPLPQPGPAPKPVPRPTPVEHMNLVQALMKPFWAVVGPKTHS
jgi:lysozyme family protein